jgi:hypothetical protein
MNNEPKMKAFELSHFYKQEAIDSGSRVRRPLARAFADTVGTELATLQPANGHAEQNFYDRRVADVLADVSSWSYSDGQTLIEALAQRGIVPANVRCKEISVSNEPMFVVSTAFIIRSGNVGVLSFRGTVPSNALNFLTDANVQPKNFSSMGQVHGGFHRNVRAVWTEIAAELNDAIGEADEDTKLKALYITGHSLGGAMAVIAAATIFSDPAYSKWRPLVAGIYTYGQPMVGDAAFAKSCGERFGKLLFRHVYHHDLIPRMPPLSTGHFEHFGAEYAGTETGWTPRSKAVVQARTVALSVPLGALAFVFQQLPLLSRLRLPFSLADHSPNGYLEAFRAARS